MATTYAYLVDPNKQYMTKSGTINVAGTLRVYDAATDDIVITYKDFMGTENEEDISLDNNGRAIVIADSSRAYRLEVYDRYGSLQWTVSPLWCQAGGGGASIARTDIVSSDGTVEITKTVVGSTTTFDLSTDVEDSTDLLEWIRCEGNEIHSGVYTPIYVGGTMEVLDDGIGMYANRYYHVTAHVKCIKPETLQPFYDDVMVHLVGRSTEDPTDEYTFQSFKLDVDYTMVMPQVFEVSTDILAQKDFELLIKIDNAEISGATFEISDIVVHRVFSGAPALPGGAASKPWVYEEFQEKLTAGDGIVISEDNVISATAAQQQQADWLETNTGSVTFIQNKPDLTVYATKEEVSEGLADKQDTLIVGDNITIIDNVISATAEPQRNADWLANSGVEEILNKPDLSIYAEKSEVAEELADKQDVLTAGSNITIENNVISATAEPQKNADWNANSGVEQILNKPDLSVYATKSEVAEDLADKQDVLTPGSNITIENNIISATAEPQVNADWEANSGVAEILHKPDLSVYATKEEVSEDLEDYQEKLTAGDNITIEGNVISAAASEQVNADWLSNSGKSEILNKPDLSVYATKTEVAADLADYQPLLTAGDNISITNNVISAADQLNSDWDATSGVQEILNKPIVRNLIPGDNITMEDSANGVVISATAAPQVNADWDASSGVSAILNKPDLSVYATETELTTGLAGKQDNMVVLTYGTSTWADFTAAYDKNAVVYCRVSTGTNQYRLAFMAYRNATGVEFQYVRSISTHDATNQGDQVFVYKLDSTNTWTTTTREMVLQAQAGNGVTRTVSTSTGAGTITWAVKAGSGVTVDSNGVSVTNPVPSYDSSDADKVLGVVTDGVTTALQWVQGGGGGGGGGSYSAGEGISILGEEISVKAGTGLGFDSTTEELVVNVPVPDPTSADEDKVLGVTDANGTLGWVDQTPSQVNSDWNANSGVAQILNKPDLSQYATYADLLNKQDTLIPGSHIEIQNNVIYTDLLPQVNSDWNADSGVAEILHKPDVKPLVAGTGILITEGANAVTVEATGGSYTQVNADWDATSGVQEILNKPTLATVATTGAYSDLSGTPTLATVATSGDYSDLLNKPTINNVPAVTSSDDNKVLKASYDGGVGSYSWEEAPATQVNSDWEATSGVAEILNKPDLVDIVAGPGIVIDNPDGNTLRVSVAQNMETVLCDTVSNSSCTLSEAYTNFERIRIEWQYGSTLTDTEYSIVPMLSEYYTDAITTTTNRNVLMTVTNLNGNGSTAGQFVTRAALWKFNGATSFEFVKGYQLYNGTVSASTAIHIRRIVGIHRIASN